MRIIQLIEMLRGLMPHANDRRLACFAMLICDRDPPLNCINKPKELDILFEEIQMRLQSVDDQHAAVAEELDQLALTQPCEFEPKHVWTLIRAIKVQSQFVDLLTGAESEQPSNVSC